MKKDTITLSAIAEDLQKGAAYGFDQMVEWRLVYIFPFVLLAVLLGVWTQKLWLGLLILLPTPYHIVCLFIEWKKYRAKKKAIKNIRDRDDISISVEKLSSIATERVYEPHMGFRRLLRMKEVRFYYFHSGKRWRIPVLYRHYAWSKDYYISTPGHGDISVSGNEFYYISLQGQHDIAYIYPCKNFSLAKELE